MEIKSIKKTLIIFFGLVILSFAVFSYAKDNAASDKNIVLDTDQDGLSDKEETDTYKTDPKIADTDGDGYKDGAEVKSRYDPTKPAPGDKLASSDDDSDLENANLTQEVSARVAALVNERAGDQQDIAIEDLDSLIQDAMGSSLTFDDLPAVDEKEIKKLKQNYKKLDKDERKIKEREDTLKYLTAVSYILASNSPYSLSDPEDLDKVSQEIVSEVATFSLTLNDVSFFKNLAEKGSDSMEQLKEIEVPENMLETHKKGIQLMNYATSIKDNVQPDINDPLSSIVNLSKMQNFISLSMKFTEEVSANLVQMGISEIPLEL